MDALIGCAFVIFGSLFLAGVALLLMRREAARREALTRVNPA